MRFWLNPYIAIPLAAIALILAWAIWYVLVRPVPEKTAYGIIIGQNFQEAETVKKSVPRISRSLEHTSFNMTYALPDRDVYEIRLDGRDDVVHFSVPKLETPAFETGQRVQVVYLERHIPFKGTRFYVKEMKLAENE